MGLRKLTLAASHLALVLAMAGSLTVQDVVAGPIGFSTDQTGKYLLIGTGPRSFANAVDVDNRALDGDIAITDQAGDIELSNVAVTGSRGIDTTQTTVSDVTNGISNSTFNGNPFSAANGINLGVDFTTLNADLATASTWISAQAATQTFATDKFSGNQTINLVAGLNIIDIGITGSDFLVENGTLTITTAAVGDVFAIFRVKDQKFQTSNAKIIASGLAWNNVLFYNGVSNQEAFNLSNIESVDTMGIGGVSFWALGDRAEININNGSGCTQLVADKINLNNVDLSQCGFIAVPDGGTTLTLLGGALMGLGLLRRKLRG